MRVTTGPYLPTNVRATPFDGYKAVKSAETTIDKWQTSNPMVMPAGSKRLTVVTYIKLLAYPAAEGAILDTRVAGWWYNFTGGWALDVTAAGRVRGLLQGTGAANVDVDEWLSDPLSLNVWYHVGFQVYSSDPSNRTRILIDGIQSGTHVRTSASSAFNLVTPVSWFQGAENDGTGFISCRKCNMVADGNNTWSDAQILGHKEHLWRPYASPMGDWPMDESTGTTPFRNLTTGGETFANAFRFTGVADVPI